MNATSTHDTKRGEDTASRISVLSELAEEWKKCLASWSALNRSHKTKLNRREAPDRNDEYALYQTLIGAFPSGGKVDAEFIERIKAYSVKAVREAKVHTEWLKPDLAYEAAFVRFIEAILTPAPANRFLSEFSIFAQKIAHYGALNSLSQTLLKIASPGVPDFYQGTELWDLSLVDPDNRRAVDFAARQHALASLTKPAACDPAELAAKLLEPKHDGRMKLFLIQRALRARNKHRDLFQSGDYLPLAVRGRFEEHLIAFARHHQNKWAVAIAPRLLTRLIGAEQLPIGEDIWQDTAIVLPEGAPNWWRDQIVGNVIESEKHLRAGAVLPHCSVALLLSVDSPNRANEQS
jgi:(1->4)-alpha-D-glucan 1-alpha-D-glucosylmutase